MNIDEAIALLVAELDAEDVEDLVGQFLADTPAQIVSLRDAAKGHDLATLGRIAHSVAGSSSTFGLQELRAAALALEEMALAGWVGQIPVQIEAVSKTYAAAASELQRRVSRR